MTLFTQEAKNGNLHVTIDKEDQEELKDLEFIQSDATMYDVFESITANSEIDFVNPEYIGALTEAPILGIEDACGEFYKAWVYNNYMLRSPVQDLLEKGYATFHKVL